MGMFETVRSSFDRLPAPVKLFVFGAAIDIAATGAAATSWAICDFQHTKSATIVEEARERHLRCILNREVETLTEAQVCHAQLTENCNNLPDAARALLPEAGHLLKTALSRVQANHRGLAEQGIIGAGTMPSPADAAMVQRLRDVGSQVSDPGAAQHWAGLIVAWSATLDSAQERGTLTRAEALVLQALEGR